MRGINFPDTNRYVAESLLMKRYNQPYSEIKDMPLKTILFLIRLAEAEDMKTKADMDKAKAKIKKR